jgi:hypothetical protein
VRRITAVAVASAAVVASGCFGDGSQPSSVTGLACQTLQGSENTNNWSNCLSFNGGGGGTGGSGTNAAGEAPAALYRLLRVNGAVLPWNADPGGVEDSVVTADSTRVENFILDSSYISLNTDSTVTRIDYMTIRDVRIASTHPPANFSRSWFSLADSSAGAFTDSTGQPEIELLSGYQIQNVGWEYNGDTLTATAPFVASDSENTQIITSAYFTYENVGSPYNNTQKVVPRNPHLHGASSTTPIGKPGIGSAGLGIVGSDDGRRSLVGVVGQQH